MALETVQEIINQAIADSGVSIDLALGRRWLNEAMQKNATLYDTACVTKPATITCVDTNDYYDLPTGCLKVSRVQNSDGFNNNNYITTPTQIKFYYTGTYTVTYLVEPKAVTTSTEEPECHSLYNMPNAQYLRYKALEGKKNDEANAAYSEFLTMSKSVDTRLKGMKKAPRIPARRYR